MTVIMLHAAANAKVAATRHGQQLRIARRRRRLLLLLLQLRLQCIRIQLEQHSVRRFAILLATLAWFNDAWQASVCNSCCCCILLRGATAPAAATTAAVAVIVAAHPLLLLLGTECSGRRVLIAQHTRLVHQLKVVQPKRLITGRMSWPGLGRRLQLLLLGMVLLMKMMMLLLLLRMMMLLVLQMMFAILQQRLPLRMRRQL